MINFFGYFKQTNAISITSVNFDKVAIFLRNHDFCVVELSGLKGGSEVNLLWENEEPCWITKEHHTSISGLLEENDTTPILYAMIKLANSGMIHFNAGELYVKYPLEEDLKMKVIQVLETMGYYAAKEILHFCENNPDTHLLSFVLGMEPIDITDEFDRMKQYTEELKHYWEELNNEEI